jgi:hypothetical protein
MWETGLHTDIYFAEMRDRARELFQCAARYAARRCGVAHCVGAGLWSAETVKYLAVQFD